jgi:predicted alpha/beta hydrolase family esterase
VLNPILELNALDILTIPGLDGSGPDHWQTLWEAELPNCRRVEMPDWAKPNRAEWVESLDQAIAAAQSPTILVAHSLGCLTVAWWAKEKWQLRWDGQVLGALLVAPPCVEGECATERIVDFRPAPRTTLPFPTLLVASRDDPYASIATSQRFAAMWGSELIDAGNAGHINAASRLGRWEHGIGLLAGLAAAAGAGAGGDRGSSAPDPFDTRRQTQEGRRA